MVAQKEDYAVFPWCTAPEYIIELVCDLITLKMEALSKQLHQAPVPGGGNPHMKGVGMLVGNFTFKPLKETDLGVAQTFFDP